MARDAFLIYVDDWLSSGKIELMDAHEERGYLRLLMRAWKQTDCGLPNDDMTLSSWSKMGTQWFRETAERTLRVPGVTSGQKVRECFTLRDGRLYNERQLAEREYQEKYHARQTANGGKGGRPRKPKDNPEETHGLATGNPDVTQTKARAVSVSGSVFYEETTKPEKTEISSVGRFLEWWSIWSVVRGTHHEIEAVQAWISVVTEDLVDACIDCTASYLDSLTNPASGYNPDNFLFVHAKQQFKTRWPSSRNRPDRQHTKRNETRAVVEVLMGNRRKSG